MLPPVIMGDWNNTVCGFADEEGRPKEGIAHYTMSDFAPVEDTIWLTWFEADPLYSNAPGTEVALINPQSCIAHNVHQPKRIDRIRLGNHRWHGDRTAGSYDILYYQNEYDTVPGRHVNGIRETPLYRFSDHPFVFERIRVHLNE